VDGLDKPDHDAFFAAPNSQRHTAKCTGCWLRVAQQIVDFAEQLIRPVRLANEAAIIGNFRLRRLYLTRGDDQEDVGPTSVNLSREVHPVARARHLNVGEKQPHVVAGFQQFQSGVGVLGFDDAKAVIFKQTSSVQAQKLIVFDYEDHLLRLAHKN
jgi:hypothetical protein